MVESAEAAVDEPALGLGEATRDGLETVLRRLDRLLALAVTAAQAAYGPEASSDPFRGLHIDQREVELLLARPPAAPTFQIPGVSPAELLPDLPGDDVRLAWLAQTFGLSLFDLDTLLIALAPELDLRYERLYAYLQDDVSRRWPSIDLILNLLCPSIEAKLACRAHFAPGAPLIYHGLLHLIPDPNQIQPPLLAQYVRIDSQIVRLLLGQWHLDPHLAPFCHLVEPSTHMDELPLNANTRLALPQLAIQSREAGRPLRLYFSGPRSSTKRRAAEVLAGAAGVFLLVADLAQALGAGGAFDQTLNLLFREAWLLDTALYLEGLDALQDGDHTTPYQQLLNALADSKGLVILAGARPWAPGCRPIGALPVHFPIPDFARRHACWRANLAVENIEIADADQEMLAGRFRLTPDQIVDAVMNAQAQARWRAASLLPTETPAPSEDHPIIDDLFAAARAQSGHELARLAHKIEPCYTWDDIVLPDDTLAQLKELCKRVTHRHRVMEEWGFASKLSLGKGINVLFAGSSGTGKTMAAEIVANELGLDLYKIDLSGVVSKYIGETEKNLDRIFTAAENTNAILFFDEADALFGKRSEVRDSHDRYANIEIAYLLQKMEEYEGVAILATNLRQNLDESFVRRLAFTIHFPFPDDASRRRIWTGIWPQETPLANDIDLDFMARQFKLSGGNIKNIALAAAFLAAANGHGGVTMAHLIHATQREYQKLGKPLNAAELGCYAPEVAA